MIKTYGSVVNITRFINYYLKPGGRFVFTAFDGSDIVNLLKEHDGKYNVHVKDESGKLKYSILKNYTGHVLLPTDQTIKVLLPFSNGTYYEESLVNINYLESEFNKLGITLEINKSFSEYIDSYKQKNNLDNDDKLYVGLYHYYCFYKQIKVNLQGGRTKR
jgi:hypothetical protein